MLVKENSLSLLFPHLCISYKPLLQTYLSLPFHLTYFSAGICYIGRDFHTWLRILKKLWYSCEKETIQNTNTLHWLFAKEDYVGIAIVFNDSLIFVSGKFATYMTRHFILFQKGKRRSRKCPFYTKFLWWKNQCCALLSPWSLSYALVTWTSAPKYLLLISKCPRTQVKTDSFWNVYSRLTADAK